MVYPQVSATEVAELRQMAKVSWYETRRSMTTRQERRGEGDTVIPQWKWPVRGRGQLPAALLQGLPRLLMTKALVPMVVVRVQQRI